MTREEAIDILGQRETCRECVADCTCKECDEAFEMAIKALSQEQQSEWERDHEVLKAYADGQESMKPCWIPVSERLPKEYDLVLVTEKYGFVDTARFVHNDFTEMDEWIVADDETIDVIAWMPLPQPYKGESDE